MAMLTIDNVKEYQPDIAEYGIQDFDDDFAKTEADIHRLLKIKWWPVRKGGYSYTDFDTNKLDETQLTRAAVFHCLAYYLTPKLTKFDPDSDKFNEMMSFYKERFAEEFDLVLQEGVKYDDNDDGTFAIEEQIVTHTGRLIR